jgi:hypothetical protein
MADCRKLDRFPFGSSSDYSSFSLFRRVHNIYLCVLSQVLFRSFFWVYRLGGKTGKGIECRMVLSFICKYFSWMRFWGRRGTQVLSCYYSTSCIGKMVKIKEKKKYYTYVIGATLVREEGIFASSLFIEPMSSLFVV